MLAEYANMGWGSEIRNPGSGKNYPGSRSQKGTGSQVRIRNTVMAMMMETCYSCMAWRPHHPLWRSRGLMCLSAESYISSPPSKVRIFTN